jgi:hypothetical protein
MANPAPAGAQKEPPPITAKVAGLAHHVEHHLRAVDDDADPFAREAREERAR